MNFTKRHNNYFKENDKKRMKTNGFLHRVTSMSFTKRHNNYFKENDKKE